MAEGLESVAWLLLYSLEECAAKTQDLREVGGGGGRNGDLQCGMESPLIIIYSTGSHGYADRSTSTHACQHPSDLIHPVSISP